MFYTAITATIMLFCNFSCYCMDTKRPEPKKYHLKPVDEENASEIIIFPTPLTKELKEVSHYFAPRTKKLQIPAKSRALIIQKCNEIKQSKAATKNNIALKILDHDIAAMTQENAELRQKHLELEAQKAELAKKIEEEHKRQDEIRKRIVQARAEAAQTKAAKPTPAHHKPYQKNTPVTLTEHRSAIKILMSTYKSRELRFLFNELSDVCYQLNHDHMEDNMQTGPCLNLIHHVLLGTVNLKYRYIYYPCTRKIAIHKEHFHELLNNISSFIKKEVTCGDDCTYYIPKYNPSSSSSEDNSIQHSLHSSDMEID